MDYLIVIICLLILSGIAYIYLSGKSYAFWTGGKIRYAILKLWMRIDR